jgi:branched-chain amino acid transport system substrate-binding protein
VGAQYWHGVDTPDNRELVSLFRKTFNSAPTYSEVSGYTLARLIMEGAAKAKSNDPAKVIAAMEGLEYQGPTGAEQIRSFDHQCVKDYYLLRGKPTKAMADADDFLEVLAASKSFLSRDKAGCTAI